MSKALAGKTGLDDLPGQAKASVSAYGCTRYLSAYACVYRILFPLFDVCAGSISKTNYSIRNLIWIQDPGSGVVGVTAGVEFSLSSPMKWLTLFCCLPEAELLPGPLLA